jgi:hypothetical protein
MGARERARGLVQGGRGCERGKRGREQRLAAATAQRRTCCKGIECAGSGVGDSVPISILSSAANEDAMVRRAVDEV